MGTSALPNINVIARNLLLYQAKQNDRRLNRYIPFTKKGRKIRHTAMQSKARGQAPSALSLYSV